MLNIELGGADMLGKRLFIVKNQNFHDFSSIFTSFLQF